MSSRSQPAAKKTGTALPKELQVYPVAHKVRADDFSAPIQISQAQQEQFRNTVSTSALYSKTAKAVVQFNTIEQFNNFFLEPTQNAQSDFDKDHERGPKSLARAYQSLSVKAMDFMNQFSPVLELVQACGAPYGGIAVGIVSVLFVVASSKNEIEERLASTLSNIIDRLPGIEMYKQLYNDDHTLDRNLQARIARVYEGFMAFCIKATKYYRKSASRRWWAAFTGSSSVSIEADNVQSLIVDMRISCEELLAKKVDSIKQDISDQTVKLRAIEQHNSDQKAVIEQLNIELVGLRATNDDVNVREVQRLLHQETFSESDHFTAFRKHHDRTTASMEESEDFERMSGGRLEAFKSCKEYQTWSCSSQASLIFLVGINNDSIGYSVDDCWLSPVACDMISNHEEGNSSMLSAYYVFPRTGESLYNALSIVFIQLLRRRSKVLRATTRYNELRSALLNFDNTKATDARASARQKGEAFQEVASKILDLFDEEEEVSIVIDRADRCRTDHHGKLVGGPDERKPLLKLLVKMTQEARCKLKILVVLNGGRWRLEGKEDELGISKKDRVMIHTIYQELVS